MIEFKNVTIKNFNQDNTVLENINLLIPNNSFVAIIGNSGVGKTTFLNSIVKNCEIVDGEIIVDNKKISLLKRKQLVDFRKSVGWISQKNTLIDDLTVYDNLRINYKNQKNPFLRFFNFLNKKDKENLVAILDKLNIADKCYQKVKYLSGGQQRRVEIAKLLLNKYKIIVADEPLSNLDTKSSTDVLSLLKMIKDENNSTILLTIHDVDQIVNNIGDAIIFKNKKLVFNGSINKISKKELVNYYG
ncbi:ATP-binding cassette domain-containing protein [Malacoplasma iowae]|uniref:ATP-binding cassette domain-containing protein n=1 Tax=Malacoplasma iowae TaxID=2116 RepID=UPI002A189672|nr:ATP-binding cassette domain-containing protein [Malacoplasma iowae]WPL39639.1 ATP-binding cassette domain-containing protein [Malacoplasma iowae]